MIGQTPSLSVSDFVAVFNQTLSMAYPSVIITGELANFKVSKNRWVYFDLKDEAATVRFFGSVYQLPGPLEDGLMVEVLGAPRLHHQFGFSVTFSAIRPVGEGSIKKATALLEARLRREGLFAAERKRPTPYPPASIGLITSKESAAYHDFTTILNNRWQGTTVWLADVPVQGVDAPEAIVRAIERCNALANPPEVLVITRGGGSPEDLAAFSSEPVTRAVAGSRIPTVVAVGHEIDVSLAELAADVRASTPSNAAERLVPDRQAVAQTLDAQNRQLGSLLEQVVTRGQHQLATASQQLSNQLAQIMQRAQAQLEAQRQLLQALNPERILHAGYALVSQSGKVVRSRRSFRSNQPAVLRFYDGEVTVQTITGNKSLKNQPKLTE